MEYHAADYGHDIPKERGSLEELDIEISALLASIKDLEVRLHPVMSQYATTEARGPEPEPASQLRGQIRQLVYARCSLQEITARIDL